MEVHRIVDPSYDANLYLARAEEAILIDAGTGLGTDRVLEEIHKRMGDVHPGHFILTHRHVDHVGGARALSDVMGLTPRASPDDAPSLLRGDRRSTGATLFGIMLEPLKVEVIRYGEVLNLGGLELKILHTPGHTMGSICLLGEDGSLFTGDTLFAYGGIGRWDLETGSLSDLFSSLKLLESLHVESLYPGHGPSIEGEAAKHISMAVEMAEAFQQ